MIEQKILQRQLQALGCPGASLSLIREKDGVGVYRAASGGRRMVLKYFEKEEYRREIDGYRLLAALGVPTPKVYAATKEAFLLEDIDASETLRLAREEDVQDPTVLRAVARWYRMLHEKGCGLSQAQRGTLYCEYDALTPEALRQAALRSGTEDAPCWTALCRALPKLHRLLADRGTTLVYNDFHHSNLIVARAGGAAMMYDYNFLGLGLAASDIANVCYGLAPAAAAAFREAYGPIDPAQEALARALEGPVALALAGKRAVWPRGADAILAQAQDGTLEARLRALEE